MAYYLTIKVDFAAPPQKVYDALADLRRYPEWARDMTSVSHPGPMYPGLRYITVTEVLGKTNRSEITVRDMVPGRLIVVDNKAGLVAFRAEYHLSGAPGGHTRLDLRVNLSFSQAVFNIARPVVEAVAEARIRADLEALSKIITP